MGRFSVMRHGFGDKELLFHVLLLPAAAASAPVFGAKLTSLPSMPRSHAELAQPTAARYPRHPTALGREIEAVIDIGRLGGTPLAAARCIWLAPETSVEHADVEVASTAPARLWVEREQQKTIPRSERLLPGSGSTRADPARAAHDRGVSPASCCRATVLAAP